MIPQPTDLLTQLLDAIRSSRPDLLTDDGQPDVAKLKSALKPRYGLLWDDQPEHEVDTAEREGKHPLLAMRVCDSLLSHAAGPVHALIQGDNYHALKVLNYTHVRKVDAIYIDPPYNTGNKDFRYNDKFVEKDDGFRHSKWLSFMEKRLKLAKPLLKDTGVVFISIDENERAALELLCTEELRFRMLGEIIWDKRSQKGGAAAISTSHEHVLVFANPGFTGFNEVPKPNAEAMHAAARRLVKHHKDISIAQKEFNSWLRQNSIPAAEAAYNTIEVQAGAVRLYQGTSLAKPDNKGYRYDILHDKSGLPCAKPSNGWVMPEHTYREWDTAGRIVYGQDESTQPRKKLYLDENMTEKVRSIFVHSKGGISDLRELNCGLDDKFPYPKPLGLLKHLLGLLPKDITVLDFFAGSGTTAHAVMQLNAEDKGTRQCILITNDEGEFNDKNGRAITGGICTHVTRPRLSRVIEGYHNAKGLEVSGLEQNLVFMETSMYHPKTDERGMYIEYKQFLIEAIDLLRFKEGTMIEKKPYYSSDKNTWDSEKPWGVYSTLDGSKTLVVLLDENKVEDCVAYVASLSGKVELYPFIYEEDTSAQELCDELELTHVAVHPVPGNLLKTYRRLNRKEK